VKRRDFIRHLLNQRCELIREGGEIIRGGAISKTDNAPLFPVTTKSRNISREKFAEI